MSVYRGVSGCASQVFTIAVRNMFSSFGVAEAFCESKIYNVYIMLFFADTDEEVIGLDIPMQEMARMHEFNALKLLTHNQVRIHVFTVIELTYHLISEHEDCLQGESSLAVVEEIFKTGTEQVYDHHVVIAFDAEPVHVWNTNY